jgi:hypothetical protein
MSKALAFVDGKVKKSLRKGGGGGGREVGGGKGEGSVSFVLGGNWSLSDGEGGREGGREGGKEGRKMLSFILCFWAEEEKEKRYERTAATKFRQKKRSNPEKCHARLSIFSPLPFIHISVRSDPLVPPFPLSSFSSFLAVVTRKKEKRRRREGKEGGREGRMLFNLVRQKAKDETRRKNQAMKPRSRSSMSSNGSNSTSRSNNSDKNNYIH